jgi:hypothetical protein
MNTSLRTRLDSVQISTPQIYKNIAILPLVAPTGGTLQYRTLGQALATLDVAITEVSSAGSVPELMVVNRANQAVLLIDGEELAGAKQNRVLNTSILLKELCETRIPVSCTEQGRWSYASPAFSESGNVMAHKARARKTRSVHQSLEACGAPVSDQGEVWSEISMLQAKACCMSPTSAMSDIFKAREDDLRKCDETFRPVPNQIGLIAIVDGRPAGLDLVSLSAAYTNLHPKLVRSYTLEGLLDAAPASGSAAQREASAKPVPQPSHAEIGRHFLAGILATEERQFPSVGHGADYRYRASAIAGAALIHQDEVIHAAFFRLDDSQPHRSLVSLRNRRRYQRE